MDKEEKWEMEDILGFFYFAHLGKSYKREAEKGSIKVAYIAISFYGFMLFSMYQSMISASLAVKILKEPVNGIEDFLSSKFKLIVSNSSSVHKEFLDSDENELYGKLMKSGKVGLFNGESEWVKHALESKHKFLLYQNTKIQI